ncbi:MAG: biopolymer transporter ExbD [Erythrobacter sp.]
MTANNTIGITSTRNSARSFSNPGRRFSGSTLPRMRRNAGPVGEMNVTPFIDVLLVLLIMLILAIPVNVHQTTVDLPGEPPVDLKPVLAVNTIAIDEKDALFWNGETVTATELRAQVSAASAASAESAKPQLRFEPAALASYDRAARTIVLMKEAGADGFAFVGNAQHRDFVI